MKTLYYLKRAVSLPLPVVLQKIAHKLQKGYALYKKKGKDRQFPTFASESPASYLNRYISSIDLSLLPANEILSVCEHYLRHEFNLLGSGWVQVFPGMTCKGVSSFRHTAQKNERRVTVANKPEVERIEGLIEQPYTPIDWQIDFKSGYRWSEGTWSPEISYGSEPGADVKVPWELSRMQHLIQLAWAYGLTKEASYAREFQNQILDFIAANPPRYGVNWSCTMDVGIRIANWLLSYELFRLFGAPLSGEFEAIFIRSVYEHGQHIFSHLEWDPFLRSNHYLANIAGLLFVSAYLPPHPEVDGWREFSLKELQKEILSQFHPDGSNFEASTCYHRLSAEMGVYATALAMEMGHSFPAEYWERIEKMAQFTRDVTKPDGTVAQFGDNDSGRFVNLSPCGELLDHRYLIGAIEGLLREKKLIAVMESQFKPVEIHRKPIQAYDDFGLYIQNQGPWFLAIRCGSIGQRGNGGHAHNDQLSFELAVNGISLLIDPGTYVYTPLPEQRRRFRSTAMHNTLVLEEREQNGDEGLFQLKDLAKAQVLQFEEGHFVGEHQGFGYRYRRTLKIGEELIEGTDECDYAEPKKIYFHFAPHWRFDGAEWVSGSQKIRLTADRGSWKIVDGEYSKAYGEKEKTSILFLETSFKRTSWKIQILTPSKS